LELLSAWNPIDAIEADLVAQLAISTWKMRRVSRIEAEIFHAAVEKSAWRSKLLESKKDNPIEYEAAFKATRFDAYLPFDRLMQYGTLYERRYYRALQTLMQLRAIRTNEQTLSVTPDETKAIEAPAVESEAVQNSKRVALPHLETSKN